MTQKQLMLMTTVAAAVFITQADSADAASTHTVKTGESLWSIGKMHNVSITDLKKWNKLSSDLIRPGQRLLVSASSGNKPPTQPVKPETLKSITTTHNLNLRQATTTNSTVLTVIPKGTTLIPKRASGIWYEVSYKGKSGYIHKDYTKQATQPTAPVTPPAETFRQSFVTTTGLNMRAGAGIGFPLVQTVPSGTTVVATKQTGTWYYVTHNGKSGYMSGAYLKQVTTSPTPPENPNEGELNVDSQRYDFRVNVPNLNVRASASLDAPIVASVTFGQSLQVISSIDGFYKIYIGDKTGYVSSDYVDKVLKTTDVATKPDVWVNAPYDVDTFYTKTAIPIRANANEQASVIGATTRAQLLNVISETPTHFQVRHRGGDGFVLKSSVTKVSSQSVQQTRDLAIKAAERHLGLPYVWSSSDPANGGFDCSGLIAYVFNQAGISLPRANVNTYWNDAYFGQKLSKAMTPQRGDVVFFENTYTTGPSHMGIMIDQDTFIHAGTSGLGYNKLSTTPYWKTRLIGFKRP